MDYVYVLQHCRQKTFNDDDVKLIGVYSSEATAKQAAARAAKLPGFMYQSDGFSIDSYEVDKDHWTEGYGQ